jgi:hypothetical protein
MKTTTRLLLVAAAPLLTAAPASAWCHRHTYSVPVMPAVGFGAMPMMGFGAIPTLPFAGLGTLPTTVAGGSGFSMQLSMSGDATLALLLPGLFRNLLGPLLGVAPAGGMTDAQMQTLATRFAAALRASGAIPMTAEQAAAIIEGLQKTEKAVQDAIKTFKGKDNSGKSSPELEKARADVRRLVKGSTPKNGVSLAQARAEVRRLVATSTTSKNGNRSHPVTTRVAGDAR